MAFDFTSGDDIRNAPLRSGLRGYDKAEVDEFRAAAAELVDELRRRADSASGHLAQLGLDEPIDLKNEFEQVGREVSAILESARSAAMEMRERATADATRWRADAEQDAARMRTEAWEEATTHLEGAVSEAADARSAADEDVLFIRAQAEKEAIRLTGEAKRDGEEAVRSARVEAEAIIADARQTAEAAQERTRALELRREELMSELEEARRAIGAVESQVDNEHELLTSSETATVRIIDTTPDEDATAGGSETDAWLDDDGSVRLVTADPTRWTPPSELEPVLDADDIVAEVQRLQVEPTVGDPWSDRWSQKRRDSAPDPGDAATEEVAGTAAMAAGDEKTAASSMDGAAQEPDSPGDTVGSPDIDAHPGDALEGGAGERNGEAGDAFSGLFASLRDPSEPETADAGVTPATPTPVDSPVGDVPEPDAEDASDRERVLLPITNGALRAVKKQILELQNLMLESTRLDPGGWRPDPSDYRVGLDPLVAAMVHDAFAAGGGEGEPGKSELNFGAALCGAVNSGAEAMAGSGFREVSATLGRVYRMWRSDEAERRLSELAAAGYEEGVAMRRTSGARPIESLR